LIKKYSINLEPLPIEAASIGTEPKQRCDSTTAGLGYMELLESSKQILLLGQLASVSTVNYEEKVLLLY
jgi:hypothetical protein